MAHAPEQVGPYRLDGVLGESGSCCIWRATDRRSEQPVVLKVVYTGAAGPDETKRLGRESAILQNLVDPGVPRSLGMFEDSAAGVVAFAMQLVDGMPLSQMPWHGLTLGDVMALASAIARILAVLHKCGVVHRDVNPSNVMLKPGWREGKAGSVVLVDFGIARGIGPDMVQCTTTGAPMGRVTFLAPEVLLHARGPMPVSTSLDIYSFGVTFWALVFGQHPTGLPMDASTPQLVSGHLGCRSAIKPDPQASLLERAAPGLLELLDRCVAPAPWHRPVDGAALFDALQAISLAPEVAAQVVSLPSAAGGRTPSPRKSSKIAAVGLTVLGALSVASFVISQGGSGGDGRSPPPESSVAPPQASSRSSEIVAPPSSSVYENRAGMTVVSMTPCLASLRYLPTPNASELARLPPATQVDVIGPPKDGWVPVRVTATGVAGYLPREIVMTVDRAPKQ